MKNVGSITKITATITITTASSITVNPLLLFRVFILFPYWVILIGWCNIRAIAIAKSTSPARFIQLKLICPKRFGRIFLARGDITKVTALDRPTIANTNEGFGAVDIAWLIKMLPQDPNKIPIESTMRNGIVGEKSLGESPSTLTIPMLKEMRTIPMRQPANQAEMMTSGFIPYCLNVLKNMMYGTIANIHAMDLPNQPRLVKYSIIFLLLN